MIKKILKWSGVVLILLIAGLATVVAFRQNRKFEAPYPKIAATTDPQVLARGEYLVYGPGHCADCHGPKDQLSAVEQGRQVPLTGGFTFKLPVGNFHVPNITPDAATGIGNIPDSTLARALRYGVHPDGRALLDFMPFHNTSDEDLTAIISYLRTMKPVRHAVPPHEPNLLGRAVKAFMLKPVGPNGQVPAAIRQDTSIEYGRYLANSVANCRGCHTNRDLMTGEFIGPEFAGGFQMESALDPGKFALVTPNLTPDPQTGRIAAWDERTFVSRFHMGKLNKHSVMPWGPFRRMSDNDLKAIYRYLKTVRPVTNRTETGLVKLG